jgi:hypothetical protein
VSETQRNYASSQASPGLGSGIDKDRPDYTILTGEWEVGRITRRRAMLTAAEGRERATRKQAEADLHSRNERKLRSAVKGLLRIA